MKSFKDVESTRRDYHKDATLNSVHRSSLIVPELPGATAEISFLNHFLLKRRYTNVACRLTAVDSQGQRIAAKLVPVTEPRVYVLRPSEIFGRRAENYLVEFFASDNLFIPFPAVMVNHVGDGFANMVHAYNRVLNDVFEDDAINAKPSREASVDVTLSGGADTFLVFTAGPRHFQGNIEIEYMHRAGTASVSVPVDVPRLTNRTIHLSEVLPGAPDDGVLKVRQPTQFLFYGRMLTGRRSAAGTFSANHSYYDSSDTTEYWEDGAPAHRTYPFFAGVPNAVTFYPIMSPGRLRVEIDLRDAAGKCLATKMAGAIESPNGKPLHVDISALATSAGVDTARLSAFTVRATPPEGKSPTRINHQLAYGAAPLSASINMSLSTPHVFTPAGRTGFTWGQVLIGPQIDSRLGITTNDPGGEATEIDVTFYDESGEAFRKRYPLPAGGAISIDPAEGFAGRVAANGRRAVDYAWFIATASRADLAAYSIAHHRVSGAATGEHGF